MKRFSLLLVVIITMIGIGSASAQSRNSYFMEGSYFRNDMNPALAPTRGYLALPGMSGVGVNVSSNFLSVDNFFYQRDGQLVTAFHKSVEADEFYGKLPAEGKLAIDSKVNILGVGFYSKKTFWTFGINANVSADMAMSMDAFKALKTLGNGTYDMGNAAFEANSYLDVYLGTSFRVHENVNVGIKAKFLMGVATLDAQFDKLQANVGDSGIDANFNGTFRTNGILFDNRKMANNTDFANMLNTDMGYMFDNIDSFGFAVDLGVEARFLDDHLKISAAVTDLGFIKWNLGTTNATGVVSGDAYFNGVNMESSEADAAFEWDVQDTPESGDYTTHLNFSVNAGVEYNILNNHIAFGVLSHTKFCSTMTYTELTASVNFRPTNWLSASVSHTFLNENRPGVFGFALNIHPSVINIYAGVDYVDTQWVKGPKVQDVSIPLPRYAKSVNAYVGVGFNFGRPKFMKMPNY